MSRTFPYLVYNLFIFGIKITNIFKILNQPLDEVCIFYYFGIMNTQNSSKLNQLLTRWERGAVYTQLYLSRLGYYHDLVKSYRRNGWLESIGTGAFKLAGDHVDLFGALYALQKQLELSVHIGGRTALELKGFSHYVRPGTGKCFLYAPSGTRLPKWFRQFEWNAEINFKATNLFPPDLPEGFSDYKHKELKVMISAPERAAFEMLYHVPATVTFEEAFLLIESLISLRAHIIQDLLENCNSVKVKRLFMYMAEQHKHPWLENIKSSNIDFGKGKRMIISNGILDKTYNITVPRLSREQIT